MKCFVTGADGFIGSHLAEALVAEGHEVTALAQYSSFDIYGWLDECSDCTFVIREAIKSDIKLFAGGINYVDDYPGVLRKVRGDIRDGPQMINLMQGHDIVFHLAALISVPYSYLAVQSFIDTNVTGTMNVLNAALNVGAKVVHTSTSEVYGTAVYTPQDEKHPLQAQSPYAASKIAADKLVESFHLTYGLPVITLRPFNTYGPRQSERAVIPTILRQAVDPKCEQIRLGDVTPRRDFNYVDDTVAAFIAAMGLFGDDDDVFAEPYNVGSGECYSIGEVAQIATKKSIRGEAKRHRPEGSEVHVLRADASRFRAATSWQPKVGLAEGLRRTADWWREREYRPDAEMMV